MNKAFQIFYEELSTNPREPRHIIGAAKTRPEAIKIIADQKGLNPGTDPMGYGISQIYSTTDAYQRALSQIGKVL